MFYEFYNILSPFVIYTIAASGVEICLTSRIVAFAKTFTGIVPTDGGLWFIFGNDDSDRVDGNLTSLAAGTIDVFKPGGMFRAFVLAL